jgi:hypothetical protein
MHLLRDDIVALGEQVVSLFCRHYDVPEETLYDWQRWSNFLPAGALPEYSHTLDFGITGWIAKQAQTFLFDHEQILAFLAAVDRQLAPGDYPAPFPFMIIQFDSGIDEMLLTTGIRSTGTVEDNDQILGLVLAMPDDGETPTANVIAWYSSTSINRVQLSVGGDGSVEYAPLTTSDDSELAATLRRDKQRIANLALLCLAYIHSPGIETERVQADPAVNRRRVAKGKRELPDYYICRVHRATSGQSGDGATGRHVSFRFDIRGHWRRLTDGRTIWVRAHQRGLANELYKPKTYRVD